MPLWKVYHPKGAYTPEDKKGIAQAITAVYGRVMPKFYVGVVFQEVPEDDFYIGGEPHPRFFPIPLFLQERSCFSAIFHLALLTKPIEDRNGVRLTPTLYQRGRITDAGKFEVT